MDNWERMWNGADEGEDGRKRDRGNLRGGESISANTLNVEGLGIEGVEGRAEHFLGSCQGIFGCRGGCGRRRWSGTFRLSGATDKVRRMKGKH